MTQTNGGDQRFDQLRDLVFSLAQSVNQSNQQQAAINQQLSSSLSEFIEQSNSNFERLTRDREETNREISELRSSQRDLGEFTRSVASSVDTLANEVIPQFVTRMEEMQSEIRGLQAENRRLISRVFGEQP